MKSEDGTAWSRLFHLYGMAPDAPRHLDALRRDDLTAVDDESADGFRTQVPSTYLWSALYGDGRLTPATVPALRNLAGMLTDPGFGRGDETVREGVLHFIHEIARTVLTVGDIGGLRLLAAGRRTAGAQAWLDGLLAAPRPVADWTEDDEPGRVLMAAAVVDCHDVLPEVYAAVEPLLHEPWPARTRRQAAHTAARLVSHPDLAEQRAPLLEYHERLAATVAEPRHRASLVAGIGRLGGEPRAWLEDDHLGVRVCAALAPALATDPVALQLLVRVSRAPRALSAAFGEALSSATLDPYSAEVADTICRRVDDFDELYESALAALPFDAIWLSPQDAGKRAACEPYLRAAFPNGLPESGEVTIRQGHFANAAFDRDELWADPDGSWQSSLRHLGLPTDRSRWQVTGQLPTIHTEKILIINWRSTARNRPQMYTGAQRTDPGLPTRLVEMALEALVEAEAPEAYIVIADDHTFTMGSAGQFATYPVDGRGLARSMRVMTVPFIWVPGLPPPFGIVGFIDAYCALVTINAWVGGVAYAQEFADSMALTPPQEIGLATRTGYQATFHLDTAWLPKAARILDVADAHEMITDRRSGTTGSG